MSKSLHGWTGGVVTCGLNTSERQPVLVRHRLRPGVATLIVLAGFCPPVQAQSAPVVIPSSTLLPVELLDHVPMKTGAVLQGRLLYPVYVNNHLVIAAGATVQGTVTRLEPDRARRIHARFSGDFTPFHNPIVRFNEITLPSGITEEFASEDATAGAPLMRLSPSAQKAHQSWIRRQIAEQEQSLKAEAAVFTAPGRWDRARQFFYQQLPYHPERIEKGTAWTLELRSPLLLREAAVASEPAAHVTRINDVPAAEDKSKSEEWRLHAYLDQAVSSASQKPGSSFRATVAEPVFRRDHTLEIPQGAALIGEVTQAKPARSFGRAGKLRFHFSELRLPEGFSRPVEGSLSSVDAGKVTNLKMDAEGGVQPQAQNRVIVPLVLSLLANRAFSDDGSQAVNSAVASNGFGILGRVVGIVGGSKGLAAGIGFYAAGLAIVERWLTHGKDVSFAKFTRVEVTIAPARSRLPVGPSGNAPPR